MKTIKGKGVKFMENNNDWHHGRLTKELYKKALTDLKMINLDVNKLNQWAGLGPRAMFGNFMLELGKSEKNLIVLSADLRRSSGLDRFKIEFQKNMYQLEFATKPYRRSLRFSKRRIQSFCYIFCTIFVYESFRTN